MKIIQLGNMRKGTLKFSNPQTGRVYSIDGIAPTINTCQGGEREPKVVVKKNMIKIPMFLLTPNNFAHKAGDGVKTRKREIRFIHPALQATPGATQCTYLLECWEYQEGEKVDKEKVVCERRMDEGLRTFKDGVIGTIRTIDAGGDKRVIEWKENKEDGIFFVDKKYVEYIEKENLSDKNKDNEQEIVSDSGYRIRKLTPLETWRLMGFSDEDFLAAKVGDRKIAKKLIEEYEPTEHLEMMQEVDKISKVSNTQLYKQAGNSIVVDVLYYIFKELYEAMPYLFDDLKVSSYFSGIGAFERALDRLYVNINLENVKTSPV